MKEKNYLVIDTSKHIKYIIVKELLSWHFTVLTSRILMYSVRSMYSKRKETRKYTTRGYLYTIHAKCHFVEFA